MSHSPLYLLRRTSKITGQTVWHWRRRVPTALVEIIGKTHWTETVRTSDKKAAEIAARSLNAEADEIIANATLELRRRRGVIARLSSEEREIVTELGGLEGLRSERNRLLRQSKFTNAAAEILRFSPDRPRSFYLSQGVQPDQAEAEAADAAALAQTIQTQLDQRNAILSRANLKPLPGERKEPDTLPPPSSPVDLHHIVDRWATETKAPRQHVEQYGYAVRRFTELHGTLALKEVTKEHIRVFKDWLARLPISTRSDIRKASIRAAVAIADKHDVVHPEQKLPRLDERTVSKHLTSLSTMLNYAVSQGFLESSPMAGFKVFKPVKKKSGEVKRASFKPDQLRLLDASLADATADQRWVFLLAAYQGARMEEICQLHVADITKTSGTWTLKITDEGDGRRVKNAASVRTVPLHPHIIERGFLDHVQAAGAGRLFPTLHADKRGRFGGPYGKWFARLMNKVGLTDRRLTFHSLRHTFKTLCRTVEMPDVVSYALMGHTEEGNATAAKYGEGPALDRLAHWIAKVDPFAC